MYRSSLLLDGLCDNWNKKSIGDKGSSSLVGNLPKWKFDRNQSKKFYEFYLKVSKEIYRIIKPGVHLYHLVVQDYITR